MLNILADALMIATGRHAPRRPAPGCRDGAEVWHDRFPPRSRQDRDRPGYGWFNPGPDQSL